METLFTVGVVAVVAIIVLLIGYIMFRRSYRVAAPNEALVITGRSQRRGAEGDIDLEAASRVVVGGRAFIRPLFDRAHSLSLSSRQISIQIEALSSNSIPLKLRGVAQIKIGESVDDVRKAAQRFLDQQAEIDNYSGEVLSGTMRSAVGTLTVEEVLKDRKTFSERIQHDARESMNNQGLVIDTFQIISIEDDQGEYLRDLGRPEAAAAAKRASIAESEAERESTQAQNSDAEAVAESNKTLELRQAEIQRETARQKAEAEAADELARSEQRQRILDEQQKIADSNNDLRERELIAEVQKPADAERYATERRADAQRYEREQGSQAELAEARNAAEAVQEQGRADASAIAEKGRAEAESVQASAEAYKQFNEAAVLSQVLEALPKVAHEVSAPYSNIESLSVVSSDGESKLSQNVSSGIAQTFDMVKSTTGLDLHEFISGALRTNADPGADTSEHKAHAGGPEEPNHDDGEYEKPSKDLDAGTG
ncbi:MAG: flotillin family protein [Nesterenkonia sp.]